MTQRLFYLIKFGLVIKKTERRTHGFQKVHVSVNWLAKHVLQGNPVNGINISAENVKKLLMKD